MLILTSACAPGRAPRLAERDQTDQEAAALPYESPESDIYDIYEEEAPYQPYEDPYLDMPEEDAPSLPYYSSEPDMPEEEALPQPAALDAAEPQTEQHYSIAPQANLGITAVAATSAPQLDLNIPHVFRVTRPARQNNYRITTDLAAYFITGTSNPNQPLFFAGSEVQRLGTQGTWGVLVQLNIGDNTFTASQGDQTTTITITRRARPGVVPINNIVQNSMFPATQGGVRVGGSIPVECIAPAGSTVIASFGNNSVTLQQVAAANPGTPATFRGQLPVGHDFPAGVTTMAGKVNYQLTFNGVTTDFQSSGDIFVAGEGSHIAVRVNAYLGIVYTGPNNTGAISELLKTGATDFVYSETNASFRLFSGGYISKNHAEIITGEVRIGNTISSVTPFFHERRETYTFAGINRTAYRTQLVDGVFHLTFFNTAGAPAVDASQSRLFSSVTPTANAGNSVTYSFRLRDLSLWWGYQIWFDGDNTVIRFQYRPRLSGNPNQPLSGVTIMLDPGHGGTDPGALGIAAGVGPDENILNLANTLALRDELTALGAEVLLTRTRLDQTVSLDERLQAFERSTADLFISIHHNSLLESTDGNTVTGAESFFHTPTSAGLSRNVLDSLVAATGRNRRQSNQSTFRMTLLPKAPSMLLEMGFMSHPIEYERLSDPAVIRQNARGIAQGIVNSLR